jgi:hypothetical protein
LLIVADDRAGLEADIAAGRLTCPRCGRGVLGGWGCARRRPVRTLEGAVAAATARALPGGGVRGDARVVAGYVFVAAL